MLRISPQFPESQLIQYLHCMSEIPIFIPTFPLQWKKSLDPSNAQGELYHPVKFPLVWTRNVLLCNFHILARVLDSLIIQTKSKQATFPCPKPSVTLSSLPRLSFSGLWLLLHIPLHSTVFSIFGHPPVNMLLRCYDPYRTRQVNPSLVLGTILPLTQTNIMWAFWQLQRTLFEPGLMKIPPLFLQTDFEPLPSLPFFSHFQSCIYRTEFFGPAELPSVSLKISFCLLLSQELLGS